MASIQYRVLSNKASDAYYKLSNAKSQIQAYVFDGKHLTAKYPVPEMKLSSSSLSVKILPKICTYPNNVKFSAFDLNYLI